MATDKPEECESCGWETPDLVRNKSQAWHDEEIEWLCEVCENTLLPNRMRDPASCDESTRDIMQHVTTCTHMILAEIRKSGNIPLAPGGTLDEGMSPEASK